jgi:hypothetical protein
MKTAGHIRRSLRPLDVVWVKHSRDSIPGIDHDGKRGLQG